MPNGHDKNYVRLCAAIDGFRVRYGRWPTRVRLSAVVLSDLEEHLFTPEDFLQLTRKVALIPSDVAMVAEDESGAAYNYGQEGFPSTRPTPSAADWLGVYPKPETFEE